MPAKSEKQRRAAAAEYSRRKEGAGKSKDRPFGTAKVSDIRDFMHKKKKRKK